MGLCARMREMGGNGLKPIRGQRFGLGWVKMLRGLGWDGFKEILSGLGWVQNSMKSLWVRIEFGLSLSPLSVLLTVT